MNNVATLDTAASPVTIGGASSIGALLMNPALLGQLEELAKKMATSKITIPDHLRGSVGDCYAIVMQSVQWGMNPFAVAQKTHVVSGKLGYEAQLVNAVITSLAPTKDRLHYEWFGDWTKILGKFVTKTSQKGNDYRAPAWKTEDEAGLGVRCWAHLKGENEPRVLELLLTQALTRNSTLWADDPRQQLAYLATKRWARLYCPDVILGVYTPDEYAEVAEERDITPAAEPAPAQSRTASVRDKLARGKPARPSEPVPSPVVEGEVVAPAADELIVDELIVDELIGGIAGAATVDALRQVGTRVNAFLAGNAARKAFRADLMAAYTARGAALDAEAKASAPAITYAEIADRLNRATTQDARDEAASLIGELPDEGQRAELVEMYESLRGGE